MSQSNSSSSGIGFCGLLTIVFITLKLLSIINWSWWWVLSPIIIPTLIALLIFGIALVFIGISMVWPKKETSPKKIIDKLNLKK